mgnify:CR=1 FL=1
MFRSRAATLAARAVTALVAACVVVAAVVVWEVRRPLEFPVRPYSLDVRPGASVGSVARTLAADGVLAHPAMLTIYARLSGADRSIKAGQYEFDTALDLGDLVARLTQGDVTLRAITFVEGTTWAEVKRRIMLGTFALSAGYAWLRRGDRSA